MSGGSYDYAFGRVNDMAEKLSNDKSSLRRAFARHLRRVGTAMHAIEWVDSGDFGKGEDIDAIKKVLGVHWGKDEIEVLIQDGNDLLDPRYATRTDVRDIKNRINALREHLHGVVLTSKGAGSEKLNMISDALSKLLDRCDASEAQIVAALKIAQMARDEVDRLKEANR